MELFETQQAGLGFIGWLIVVIAATFLWNMITKKDKDKEDTEKKE
ncbi:MAG: hypothetical protein HJHJAOHD_02179 [Flavobacteriales bacterium]|nr:hypothetical protein [Flavobacteriales bacterium]